MRFVLLSRSAYSGEYGTVTPAREASNSVPALPPLPAWYPSTRTKYVPASSAENSASYCPGPLRRNDNSGTFSPAANCFGKPTFAFRSRPFTGRSFSSRASTITRTRPSLYSVAIVIRPFSAARIAQFTVCSQNFLYRSDCTQSLSHPTTPPAGCVRASEVNATDLPRPY